MPSCRPALLPRAVESFRCQDYPNKRLVILDTVSAWRSQNGDCWCIIHPDAPLPTLGEMFDYPLSWSWGQFCFAFGDDDLLMPGAISAWVEAIGDADYLRPSLGLEYHGSFFRRVHADGYYTMGFCRFEAFVGVGGYGTCGNDMDINLYRKMKAAGKTMAIYDGEPRLAFNRTKETDNLSSGKRKLQPVVIGVGDRTLEPRFDRDYYSLPVEEGVRAKPFEGRVD